MKKQTLTHTQAQTAQPRTKKLTLDQLKAVTGGGGVIIEQRDK